MGLPVLSGRAIGAWLLRIRTQATAGMSGRATTVISLCCLVLLGLLSVPLLTGRVPTMGDLGAFHLPLKSFYARCLATGESFDWIPDLFCGFYLVGEGQIGAYHPLHLLLYRVLPLDTAFNIEVLLPFPVMWLGMFFFLARHTERSGAALGALLMTFSTWYLSQIRHVNIVSVLAHLPWLLWAFDRSAIARRSWQVTTLVLGGLLGSQILLGYPPALWYSLIALACYAAYVGVTSTPPRSAWLALAAGMGLGLMLGAVQLVATSSVIAETSRDQVSLDWIMVYSLDPSSVLGILAPSRGLVAYFGCAALVLLSWWIPRQFVPQWVDLAPADNENRSAERRLALAALGLAVLAIWMALGRYGGLYYLHTLLPVVGKFRHPMRMLILADLGIAVAAAVAFSQLLRHAACGRTAGWRQLAVPGLVTFAASLATVSSFSRHPESVQAYLPACLLLWGSLLALGCALRGHTAAVTALAVLGAIDLGIYGLAHPATAGPAWRDTASLQEWVARQPQPPEPGTSRVMAHIKNKNEILLHGHSLANGYVALAPKRELDYRVPRTLRLASVAWQLTPQATQSAQVTQVPQDQAGHESAEAGVWRRVHSPLPRVRCVTDVVVRPNASAAIRHLDLLRQAVVAEPVTLDGGSPGQARLLQDRPGQVQAEFQVPDRQLLVVSESFHSGWKAFVDGRPAKVLKVNGDFMGCVVQPGEREAIFVFRPASLRHGKLISLAGLLLAAALLLSVRFTPLTSGDNRVESFTDASDKRTGSMHA